MFVRKTAAALAAGGVAISALAAGATATSSSQDRTKQVRRAVIGGQARNVIFLLGDGMGDSEITLARDYVYGAAGRLPGIDAFPFTGEAKTYSLIEQPGGVLNGKPNYVTDSAAAGTAWATGRKTSNGRISTSIDNRSLPTILEQAQAGGFVTGNVSTAEITDATPAVLDAHVNDRDCQGPANMATCPTFAKPVGPGSIAEQTVDHDVDVVLGGGRARFEQTVTGGAFAGQTVLQQAQAQGYSVVTDATGLDDVDEDTAGKVLGLFNEGTMTTEWSGTAAAHPATGPQTCYESNRLANAPDEPSLAAMTQKAIDLLDQKRRSAPAHGFFLQVEGASIDKQDHAANPCAQIGETIAFDQAIQVARAYAAVHRDTLVIVTADHAHTSQIVGNVDASTPGVQSIVTTHEGAPLYVNYATSPAGASQQHTGSEVRIAAQGPQAANVSGVINETDEYAILRRALGVH
jgi:alkaline phosphatase